VITEYVEALGRGSDPSSPLFRPVRNTRNGKLGEIRIFGSVSHFVLEVSDEKIEKRRKEMMQFNFTCRDGTGRGAAITGPLKDAGINIEYTHFWIEENFFFPKWRTGRGILVVHDYDGENAKWVLERLQKSDKGLGIKNLQTFYQVRISIPDKPGTLYEEIEKLAKYGIYLRSFRGPEGNDGQNAIFFLLFEGQFENYIKAKELLAEHIVGESPFVPGFIS